MRVGAPREAAARQLHRGRHLEHLLVAVDQEDDLLLAGPVVLVDALLVVLIVATLVNKLPLVLRRHDC
jgi:hypothetical protein